tara:strand:- start:757 stop:864 length:108 start_codon:yes stop_codon:yes gene_type:complete
MQEAELPRGLVYWQQRLPEENLLQLFMEHITLKVN